MNLGQVNTGQVQGNLESHLHAVTGPTASEFVEAVKAFADAVQKDDALADAERGEILEDLDYLAEEANKPDAKRRPSLLGRIIGGMPNALQAAESAKTAWDTFGPTIGGFFGRTGGS